LDFINIMEGEYKKKIKLWLRNCYWWNESK
jgi:hypothetical protein